MIAQYRDKSTMGMKFGQNLGTALIVGLVYLRVPWGKWNVVGSNLSINNFLRYES